MSIDLCAIVTTITTSNSLTAPTNAAANAAAASFAALNALLFYLDDADRERVRLAYRFADEAHLGQMRKNGEPYITHPIAVAAICASWRLDVNALMAALLHDAIEDCGVTKLELIEKFGSTVADLVDGLTKLEKIKFTSREENQAESFRKMLLAMSRDIRVMLIKLADRSHNMRTLGDVPRSKWARTATETLEIHAPIAHRLGLNQTYQELQDLCLRYLRPWRYQTLSKAIAKAKLRRVDLIDKVRYEVESALKEAGLTAKVVGREKSIYSIYKKMEKKKLSFAHVNDIYGFRIVVPKITDCYTALGVLHQLYKPVPGRLKDYIAIPKNNGYQSLHTTLVGPASINIEFQTRTEEMDIVAEVGIAAHWLYKDQGLGNSSPSSAGHGQEKLGTQWLQSLLDIQSETHDASEFWDHVKVDLFPDAVYVFTPKSKILAMPRGATVLDFAYAIHSSVGHHAVSARIAGKMVPLKTELTTGDTIEILTSESSAPSPIWLTYVRTARARSKIRHHLKTLAQTQSIELGEILLTQSIRSQGFEKLPSYSGADKLVWDKLLKFTGSRSYEELMADIGLGKRIAPIVARRLVSQLLDRGDKPDPLLMTLERFDSQDHLSQGAVSLDGSEGGSVQYAVCCRPLPGDGIVGYLGHGEGLMVHRTECQVAQRLLSKDRERFINVDWADDIGRTFETGICVTVQNGKGVLAKVASSLASAEADISHIDMGSEHAHDIAELHFVVAVRDRDHQQATLDRLRRTPSVIMALPDQTGVSD